MKYKLIRAQKTNSINSNLDVADHGFQLSHESFLIQNENDREKSTKLLAALDQLPNRQREIIYLKYYLELDYEEICEIMSIQYQVARNQVSSSIKTMKKILLPILLLMVQTYLITVLLDRN